MVNLFGVVFYQTRKHLTWSEHKRIILQFGDNLGFQMLFVCFLIKPYVLTFSAVR